MAEHNIFRRLNDFRCVFSIFWITFCHFHNSRGSDNGENSRKFVTNSTVFWSFRAVLQPLLQCERQKIVQKIIKNSRNTFTYVSFLAENQAKFFEKLGSVFNKIGPKRRKGHHVYADCENFFFKLTLMGLSKNCLTNYTLLSSYSKIHNSSLNCRSEEVPSTGQEHLVYLPRWQPCTRTVEKKRGISFLNIWTLEKRGSLFFDYRIWWTLPNRRP